MAPAGTLAATPAGALAAAPAPPTRLPHVDEGAKRVTYAVGAGGEARASTSVALEGGGANAGTAWRRSLSRNSSSQPRGDAPCICGAGGSKRDGSASWLADPRSGSVRCWDVCIIVWLLFTAILSPFEVAFMSGFALAEPPEDTTLPAGFAMALFSLNRVCDAVFVLDVVLQFNLLFVDPVTQRVTRSRRAIAARYVRGSFAVDVISTIPFDLIAALAPGSDSDQGALRAMRALRLIKLLRLTRLSRVFKRLQEAVHIASGYITLAQFFCATLLITHWLACGLHMVAAFQEDECSWVSALFLDDCGVLRAVSDYPRLPSVGEVYIAALLWAMQTVTTVGYGDIQAQTSAERAYMVISMLVGGGFFSFIIGAFVGVIASLTQREAATGELVDQMNEFIATAALPDELASRLRAYFRQQHSAHSALATWRGLLDTMSPALRGEVAFAVNAAWIRRLRLFSHSPPSLLIELSLAFRPISFPPGEVLLARGDDAAAASLMVLMRGVVRVSGPDYVATGLRLKLASRERGEVFGVEALHPGGRVATTVLSVGPVRAQALRVEQLQQLAVVFPEFAPLLRRAAQRHWLRWRLLRLLACVRRVRAEVDAAAAAGKAPPQLSALAAAAVAQQQNADGEPPPQDGGSGDDKPPFCAVLLAVACAAPEVHARALRAALTLQRVWRGNAVRQLLRRAAQRRDLRRRRSLSTDVRYARASHTGSYAAPDCSGVIATEHHEPTMYETGAGHRVVLETMLREFAALKALLHASGLPAAARVSVSEGDVDGLGSNGAADAYGGGAAGGVRRLTARWSSLREE